MSGTIQSAYQGKIKTVEELKAIIGERPRDQKVVMCHGTFDVVHPGHVRHLVYASERADILVASLTCDAHIVKGDFRPFVPEQLRAMNLAAFEMVDYVIVDPNPTPLENLRILQPDYFAKGYEYSSGGIHPRTQEEMDVIEAYGGEIIFTPGDIVYSSSRLFDLEPPRIAADKLLHLMESEGVTMETLRETVASFEGTTVHVVGDTIVDRHTYCSLVGGGTKTPTLSLKQEREVVFTGGAGIVAKHLREAGARVVFSTVMGDDSARDHVLEDLQSSGVECRAIIDKTRPTTQKNVFISDGYRLLKVDRLDNRPVSDKILEELKGHLAEADSQAVIFSDFRHGVFSRQTIPRLVDSIPQSAFKVADSQVASRWGNILEFQGFDLITPNEKEARFALGDQDSVVRPLALDLFKRARCRCLILKLGERGVITYRSDTPENPRNFITVESFAERVVDAVGTGDAMLAYATLAMLRSQSDVVASILGSIAAAVACETEGNIPVSPKSVQDRLDSVEKQLRFA